MTPREGEQARPIARLQLKKVVCPSSDRAPVFHFFEELYARAASRPAEAERGARREG